MKTALKNQMDKMKCSVTISQTHSPPSTLLNIVQGSKAAEMHGFNNMDLTLLRLIYRWMLNLSSAELKPEPMLQILLVAYSTVIPWEKRDMHKKYLPTSFCLWILSILALYIFEAVVLDTHIFMTFYIFLEKWPFYNYEISFFSVVIFLFLKFIFKNIIILEYSWLVFRW